MRHTQYKDLFAGWCSRHKELRAANAAFSQMHLSLNPLQQELDLTEFYSNLKRVDGMQVILQSFHAEYGDNGGDNSHRLLHGALLVLDSVDKNDWQRQGEVYDRTERIAEELLAGVRHELNGTFRYLLTADALQCEKVGPVNNFHGVRMGFSIRQLAAPSLSFNPQLFD